MQPAWWRRFDVRGVFWRQLLHWAVFNVPIWIEPLAIGTGSMFFLLWGPGRRGVMRNLRAIKPGSFAITNVLRTYRVFWNYAWTITDTARFQDLRTIPDWEFVGWEHFEQLQSLQSGAIILTAHMGSYDLGAQMFGEMNLRKLVTVRAPEIDLQTREFEQNQHGRAVGDAVNISFNTAANDIAFELLDAVRSGDIVAIQGDRVTPGVSPFPATLFGRPVDLPAGPFALAMAARVPIYPLFVIRRGRRRYRLVTCAPITVERRSRTRDQDLQSAVDQWATELERVIAPAWRQWFAFEPMFEERGA
jgi:phosphatidylinositol dimannoside acyltransferase